jgi:hypothetical protein
MTPRRTLIEALKESPAAIDPEKEKEFVFSAKAGKPPEPVAAAVATPTAPSRKTPDRVPLTTRVRGDYATALKRASLERQLSGIEPHTLIDILEQAIEPWLRGNGYLP